MNEAVYKNYEKYLFWICLWMAALAILPYSWFPGGMDIDSCHYGVVSRTIMETGKWIGIYDVLDKGYFYTHFPLCLWITAFLFKIFGVSTFTAKLLSMFSGIALVGAIFYFGKVIKDSWVGFFAGIAILLTDPIVRTARKCRLDIPLALFITLALLFFALAQKRSRWYYLLFGISTSLAIMAKDVAGITPILIAVVYLILLWRWKELFHPLFILGLGLAIAPVLVWAWADKGIILKTWYNCNFIHLLKYTDCKVRWYFYFWVLGTKYFYLLPVAIYGAYLGWKDALKTKSYEVLLLIIWALIFPVAFSFGRQKLDYLIIPMYPATALLAGLAADSVLKDVTKNNVARWAKYVLLAGTIIVACLPLSVKSKRFDVSVNVAPVLDQLVKQAPKYEVVIYKQDRASLLFYSKEVRDLTMISEKGDLEKLLGSVNDKVRFYFLCDHDFNELSPDVKNSAKILFRYKDRIVVVNQKEPALVVTLPEK